MPNTPPAMQNMGANAAAAAVKQAVAVGAPKSIRNRLRNAAASLKAGASKLGQWMKRTVFNRGILGRRFNANGKAIKGTSRWTRGYKAGQNFLNRFKSLNRFRSGAATRRAGRNLAEIVKHRPAMFVANAHSRRSRR